MNRTATILIATCFCLPIFSGEAAEILWTQYCQHRDTMKLLVHLDADPITPSAEEVSLWLKDDQGEWNRAGRQQMYTLSSTALFEMRGWPRHKEIGYKVTCKESSLEGVFRAEPKPGTPLRMIAAACFKDIGYPWREAIDQMIKQDPDLVYFAGDQIYENDYDSPVWHATTSADVPKGMSNYLAKYRKFGLVFRDLLKDRPCIMLTDDHDVFADDLWGCGGKIMQGERTSGGYPCHPNWVNAVELTQTGMLPDAHDRGPHGDGILAYYTALEYGGVHFAILEDRKFKSAPSEVISKPITTKNFHSDNKLHVQLEVVSDPDFDCTKLDREDLQFLGAKQEAFLAEWAQDLKTSGQLGVVLSQSPWAHCAQYLPGTADLDSNGWPQSGRNRALAAIGDAPVVMVHGDVHLGTLIRHGRKAFNDGPVSYSLPAFSSKASRSWSPLKPGKNRNSGAPKYTGEHLDQFGNKMTVLGAANGWNGYGMVTIAPENKTITLDFHPMNADRKPITETVAGWPYVVRF